MTTIKKSGSAHKLTTGCVLKTLPVDHKEIDYPRPPKREEQIRRQDGRWTIVSVCFWTIVSVCFRLFTFVALASWAVYLSLRTRGVIAFGGEWILVFSISVLIGYLIQKLGNIGGKK